MTEDRLKMIKTLLEKEGFEKAHGICGICNKKYTYTDWIEYKGFKFTGIEEIGILKKTMVINFAKTYTDSGENEIWRKIEDVKLGIIWPPGFIKGQTIEKAKRKHCKRCGVTINSADSWIGLYAPVECYKKVKNIIDEYYAIFDELNREVDDIKRKDEEEKNDKFRKQLKGVC